MKKHILLGLITAALFSCGGKESKQESTPSQEVTSEFKELDKKARALFGALPSEAINPNNPITEEKVLLGKTLFFDVRLSKDNTQSCNTCHNLNTYGVDNNSFSAGNDGNLGGRNSPTVLNSALHLSQFWDGREPHVEAQSGGPILNPAEMAMPSEAAVIERLSGIKEYVELFKNAFPEEEETITYDNLKKAIGAFERKLITPSRFDKYIEGTNDALTNKEKEGLQTFINSGCVTCHTGSLLGGKMYQKFGLYADYWDFTKSENIDNGRFDATKNEADRYMFKVPSLRNIEKTAPYFHDGSVKELGDAIRIMAKVQVNKDLSNEEIDKIITFLNTLTGEVPNELKQ